MKTFRHFLFVFVICSLSSMQVIFAQHPTTWIEWENITVEVFTDHIEVHLEHYQLRESVADYLAIDS